MNFYIKRCIFRPNNSEEIGHMHSNFTAIVEKDGDWYISYCAEIPGANGQGKTKEDCLKNLAEAIELILDSFSDKQFHCFSEKL